MSERLVIVGASVRAAACSAQRAGWMPLAADRFVDVDLQSCCPAIRLADVPEELVPFFDGAGEGPWMYTGSLENHPCLIDRIADQRTLYGNAGKVLRRVRDPGELAAAFGEAGLLFPESRISPDGVPTDGTWLRKAYRSGGGSGVEVYRQRHPAAAAPRRHFFQRRVAGLPCAAVYVAAAGEACLLGITRQLVGTEWAGAAQFCYAGSIGPLRLADRLVEEFHRIGATLARQFDLVGLFGVDVVLEGERVWTIEVNPRYTASVEILERALAIDAIGAHVGACRDGRLPDQCADSTWRLCGKAILFARREHVISRALVHYVLEQNLGKAWPPFADIPHTGTSIKRGAPILTAMADGDHHASVEGQLRQRLARLERLLQD